MTLPELYEILSETELPVSYGSFPDDKRPHPPYIVYVLAYSNNFGADNKVFSPFSVVDISLYQKIKGSAEEAVETVLDANNIFWDKTEIYLDAEKVYQTIYEVNINGK